MSNLDKEFEKEEGICIFDSSKNSAEDFDKIHKCLTETFSEGHFVFGATERLVVDKAEDKGKIDVFNVSLGKEQKNNYVFLSFARTDDYNKYWNKDVGAKESQFFGFDNIKKPSFFTNGIDDFGNYKFDENKQVDIKQKIFIKKIKDEYYLVGKELKTDEIGRQDFHRTCVLAPTLQLADKGKEGNVIYNTLNDKLKENGFYDLKFNIRHNNEEYEKEMYYHKNIKPKDFREYKCDLYDVLPFVPKDQFKTGAKEFAKLYGISLENEQDRKSISASLKPKQKIVKNEKLKTIDENQR